MPLPHSSYNAPTPYSPKSQKQKRKNHHTATPFVAACSTARNSTSLRVFKDSASSSVEALLSSLFTVLSSVPIPLSLCDAGGILPVLYITSSLTTLQLVTKNITQFQNPCKGSTAALATWYVYGESPSIQLWMRFMLLGIQVTRTLRPKRRLVRRYALLMGSSTENLEATDLQADTVPWIGLSSCRF